jgi:hypothetical protein
VGRTEKYWMWNLAVHIVISGLYKAKPNWYWRPAPQAASVPLQYNPIFKFSILQEFEAVIRKPGFIISTSLLSAAPWDQLCSSTIGQGRLHIVYEVHTSIRRLLLASPERFLRQSLYSCCIRAVKKLGFEAARLPSHTLQSTERITRNIKFLLTSYPFFV